MNRTQLEWAQSYGEGLEEIFEISEGSLGSLSSLSSLQTLRSVAIPEEGRSCSHHAVASHPDVRACREDADQLPVLPRNDAS